jgi:hypothetical protein
MIPNRDVEKQMDKQFGSRKTDGSFAASLIFKVRVCLSIHRFQNLFKQQQLELRLRLALTEKIIKNRHKAASQRKPHAYSA